MENENSQKEMDLFDLIKLFWSWVIRFIFNPILFLVKFILKNWIPLLCFASLGVLASVCYRLIFPKYQTIVIYESNVGSSSDCITQIELEKESSAEKMSADLKLPVENVENIRIKPHYIYYEDTMRIRYNIDLKDKYLKSNKNALLDAQKFCVEFISKDTYYLQNIEYCVLNLLNNSNYIIAANNQRLEKLQSQVTFAVRESAVLDSLRTKRYETGADEALKLSDKGFLTTSDPMAYSKELRSLNDIRKNSEIKLNYNKDAVQIAFVSSPQKPKNSIIKTVVPFSLYALLFGVVFMLIWRYRHNIKDYINS